MIATTLSDPCQDIEYLILNDDKRNVNYGHVSYGFFDNSGYGTYVDSNAPSAFSKFFLSALKFLGVLKTVLVYSNEPIYVEKSNC